MILLFTDFGLESPYSGQVKLVLRRDAPGIPVIDLCADLAPFRPLEAGYLLAALRHDIPAGAVCLCVVDPGVGAERRPVILHADGRWYVGPDNGLLDAVASIGADVQWWEIGWRPQSLSASFHGRDLFAPVAARLATGIAPDRSSSNIRLTRHVDVAAELSAVIYIDRYGNCITGLRAAGLSHATTVSVKGTDIAHARIFSVVPAGQPFWYENSLGQVELAVNQGHAAQLLQLTVGDWIALRPAAAAS